MHLYKYLCERNFGHAYELNLLKYEIEKQIYYYGDHFKNHTEKVAAEVVSSVSQPRHHESFPIKVIRRMVRMARRSIDIRHPGPILTTAAGTSGQSTIRNKIVVKGYFNTLYSEPVRAAGYAIEAPAYDDPSVLDTDEQRMALLKLAERLANPGISQLLSAELIELISAAKAALLECYRKSSYRGVFVPYDIPFWERLVIDVFKDLGKPAVIYIHGIPGIYNTIDYNRGDYLVVWGEKIKRNFIKHGVPAGKIIVLGNPRFASKQKLALKRASLEDVLIITKSANGGQYGDTANLYNRGNLLVYLYMVQAVLVGLGVRSARFRPHPSENANWYLRNIDSGFFALDELDLSTSLKRTSLVIGPSSTVLFDSIMHGTRYVLFEPSDHGLDLINFPLVDPFDGENPKAPLARTEDDLHHFLENGICVDPEIFQEYCSDESDFNSLLSKLA